jgi:hypothetical protein
MGIGDFIRKEKEKFQNFKSEREKKKLTLRNEQLLKERQREGEKVKLTAQNVKLERDVARIKTFNAKAEKENKLTQLGRGLSSTLNNLSKNDYSRVEQKGKQATRGLARALNKNQREQQSGFNLGGLSSPFAGEQKSPFGMEHKGVNFGETRSIFSNEKKKK